MLGAEQARGVWDRLIDAETRTYYFGDLAGSYARQKQIITFLSLFLSLGAVVTVLSKAPARAGEQFPTVIGRAIRWMPRSWRVSHGSIQKY
jgi:hypothetical protein